MTLSTSLRIGLIGYGEVGQAFADSLAASSTSMFATDVVLDGGGDPARELREHAAARGVTISSDIGDLASTCDLVLSCVPAKFAIAVAEKVLARIGENAIFADLTAASPRAMNEIGQMFDGADRAFVDVAIVGPVLQHGHRVPMLVSGKAASLFAETMRPFSGNVQRVGDEPGQASAVKLCRSVFTKGLSALFIEGFAMSRSLGVSDVVMAGLRETLEWPGIETHFQRYVVGTAKHARRRSHEMSDVLEFARDLGIEPIMAGATRHVLEVVAETYLADAGRSQAARISAEDILDALMTARPVKRSALAEQAAGA